MAPFWEWEVPFIMSLQQGDPFWTPFFQILTLVGGEEFALLLGPFIYWCLSKEIGTGVVLTLVSSQIVNFGLKDLFHSPRPFQYDSHIPKLSDAAGYGLPSGHTQNTTVIWLYLATKLRRTWFWCLSAVLILGVGLSRIYLGMHFPVDVIGGLLVGLVFLGLFVALEPTIKHQLERLSLGYQICGILLAGLCLGLLHPTSDFITMAALLTGGGVGFLVESTYMHFDVSGRWSTKLLRYLVGLIGIALLWGGLKIAFAQISITTLYIPLRATRYGLVGLWGTWGAPALFMRLGLATHANTQDVGGAHIH